MRLHATGLTVALGVSSPQPMSVADECSLDAGENAFERAGENTGGADCAAVCGDICGAFVREDAHE